MKIEYKVSVNNKKVAKSLELVELGWQDFCKSTDIAVQMASSPDSQFSNVALMVQIYTGKSEADMLNWLKLSNSKAEFIDDVSAAFKAIMASQDSKKK